MGVAARPQPKGGGGMAVRHPGHDPRAWDDARGTPDCAGIASFRPADPAGAPWPGDPLAHLLCRHRRVGAGSSCSPWPSKRLATLIRWFILYRFLLYDPGENHPDFDPHRWFLIRGPPDRRHSHVCKSRRTNDELQAQETPNQDPECRRIPERNAVAPDQRPRALQPRPAPRGEAGSPVMDKTDLTKTRMQRADRRLRTSDRLILTMLSLRGFGQLPPCAAQPQILSGVLAQPGNSGQSCDLKFRILRCENPRGVPVDKFGNLGS